jgi:hypothetical protein
MNADETEAKHKKEEEERRARRKVGRRFENV